MWRKPRNPPSIAAYALDPGVDVTAAARPELLHDNSPSTLDARIPATKDQTHDHTTRLTIHSSQSEYNTHIPHFLCRARSNERGARHSIPSLKEAGVAGRASSRCCHFLAATGRRSTEIEPAGMCHMRCREACERGFDQTATNLGPAGVSAIHRGGRVGREMQLVLLLLNCTGRSIEASLSVSVSVKASCAPR